MDLRTICVFMTLSKVYVHISGLKLHTSQCKKNNITS
jgi:hypothetical protein